MGSGELVFIGFCSLAAINAILFAVYIWLKRNRNTYASTLMSVFLLITAYRITQMLLHDLQDDFNLSLNIKTFFFFIPTFPLIGPFLLLYIKSISNRDFYFKPIHLLHLLPFITILIIDLINQKNFPLSPVNRTHYLTYCAEISAIIIQFLIYILISFKFAQNQIKMNLSEKISKDNFDQFYIRKIVLMVFVIWIIFTMYCFQTFLQVYFPTRIFEALFYSMLSYWILYYELTGQRITSMNNYTARYQSSSLTAEEAFNYKEMILQFISENETYKDHNITLGKFSKSVSLKNHIVSQIINEQLCCNFNDFINSYRIEEAKKMLSNESSMNLTIASIAYDCGFNTLSAFNTAFKKFTGLTPSQYRKNIN
jgi:AraC-like DNA-binding protein